MPWNIRADDLARWADSKASRSLFPVLLRRLIRATVADLELLDMKGHEGTDLPGWDGLVRAASADPWVPLGASAWELSNARDVGGKAQEDYRKRTDDPLGLDPSSTTFVFATTGAWRSKEKWASERTAEGRWKQVRAMDAYDIEQWLEAAPAVALWFGRTTGTVPPGAEDLEGFWREWSLSTEPPLSGELCLADRSEQEKKLSEWLSGGPSSLAMKADSRQEALAFFAAVAMGLPPEQREEALSRCAVVRDALAWRELRGGSRPLVLAPVFPNVEGVRVAVSRGHHVLLSVGNDTRPTGTEIELPLPRRRTLKDRLVEMGLSEERAERTARDSGRSVLVIRRMLAATPDLDRPAWASPVNAGELIAALLAGGWDESCARDKSVVAALASEPYESYSKRLTRWARDTDAPVRQVGSVWRLTSRLDSWHLLSRHITSSQRTGLVDAATEVLGARDPALDLPLDRRPFAELLGKRPSHSSHLRRGMAQTLALLGAVSGDVRIGGVPGRNVAARVVGQVLCAATDWAGWASLSDLLPVLAEAAPDAFLGHVERALDGGQFPLGDLFAQEGGVFGPNPHVGLLWGLEVLLWSPDHASRSCLALARLAELDPGGQLANRPQETLRRAFCCWRPQTALDLSGRMRVVQAILGRHPRVGWRLLVALLPRGHETTFPLYQPEWRDWEGEAGISVTRQELFRAEAQVTEMAVSRAARDGERWSDIVSHISGFPPEQQKQAIGALSSLDLPTAEAGKVWRALRSVIHHHRSFPDADWSMPATTVDRLARCYDRLAPADPVERCAWLFSSPVELPEPHGRAYSEEYLHEVELARGHAVAEMLAFGGIDTVLALAGRVGDPVALGFSLGLADVDTTTDQAITDTAAGDAGPLGRLAIGYVWGRFRGKGWEWAKAVVLAASPKVKAAALALGLPFEKRTWTLLDSVSAEASRQYWGKVHPGPTRDTEDCEPALRGFLDAGRPRAALEAAWLMLGKGGVNGATVAEALDRAAHTEDSTPYVLSSRHYVVGQLLDFVRSSGEVTPERTAGLEWAYLPLLSHGDFRPELLHAEMARNTAFFVEVVSCVYRADGGERDEEAEVDEEVLARADRGHELLESWRGLPGQDERGEVDAEALGSWAMRAREALGQVRRGSIGDRIVGRVLANAPSGPDGLWPCQAVCRVLEDVGSRDVEAGFFVAARNNRGVTCRSPGDGGKLERDLAGKYKAHARALADQYPRTADVLRSLAESYDRDAECFEDRAEMEER